MTENNDLYERVKMEFDREAKKYALQRNSSHSFRAQSTAVRLLTAEKARGRILDVGAGPALMADHFAGRGSYYALDLSAKMLAWGRRLHLEHHIRCIVGNAAQLPFADGIFDAVIAMGVLEYLPNPCIALKEMRRVLRHNGSATITVPNGNCLHDISKRIYWRITTSIKRLLRTKSESNSSLGVGCELPHRFAVAMWQELAEQSGFHISRIGFCNSRLVAHPFSKWAAPVDDWITRHTEFLCRSFCAPCIGTQLIMQLREGA